MHPEGRRSALASLQRFVSLAAQMKLGVLTAVATAAVREAKDGADFVREVKALTGLPITVATGAEEAKLSAQGVLLGWPQAEGVVCDIGGSSMELARIENSNIVAAATSPLGPLNLQSVAPEEMNAQIDRHITQLRNVVSGDVERLYLVGGSWRAIGRIDMSRRDYPLHVLHEYMMPPEQIVETATWVQDQDNSSMSHIRDVSSARLSLAPMAAKVLERLIVELRPNEVAISSYGLREGILYAHMSKNVRKRDPLIEAARHMEAASARFPGFGDKLYSWIKPLYPRARREEKRLIRAACLMHDVNWRAHPDYRAEVCFESVTRANLGGLTHPERVYLGVALLNRYRTTQKVDAAQAALSLLNEQQITRSTVLGRAMRLGATLSGGVPGLLELSSLSLNKDEVRLNLDKSVGEHISDVVEKRLSSLATSLGRSSAVSLESLFQN